MAHARPVRRRRSSTHVVNSAVLSSAGAEAWTGDLASSTLRATTSSVLTLPGASSPEWRSFTKPSGKTCRRKRRRNSWPQQRAQSLLVVAECQQRLAARCEECVEEEGPVPHRQPGQQVVRHGEDEVEGVGGQQPSYGTPVAISNGSNATSRSAFRNLRGRVATKIREEAYRFHLSTDGSRFAKSRAMTTLVTSLLVILAAAPTRPNEQKDLHDARLIQQHLRGMVERLRTAEVTGLSDELRERRSFLIGRLEAYAERGVFPHNHVLPFQTPIFLDEHGTACAVGQLIIDSGHRELAERVRETDNTGYLLELDVEGLNEWVATSGFTADELANIQPFYGPAVSDDTWILQTSSSGETPTPIKVRRTPTWAATRSAVRSAVQWNGEVYFVDDFQRSGVFRAGAAETVERAGNPVALQVVDSKLFSLETDGVWVRTPTESWELLRQVSAARAFQVRSSTELFALVSAADGRSTAVYRLDGAEPVLVVGLPGSVSTFFVTTDSRVFFIHQGLRLAIKGEEPTLIADGATSLFGAGNQVFAVRDTKLLSVDAMNVVTELSAGLPSSTADNTSTGVVLRDGTLAIAGPQGTLMLRSPKGDWKKSPLEATQARFAAVTEGESGLIVTVDAAPCVTKDWLCEARPAAQSGCTHVGGLSLAGLLVALLCVRGARRRA
jgi:hypothetical protein